MAVPTPVASRLPDLAKCLVGDEVMLSWEDVLNALLSHDEPPSDLHRQFYAANSALISQILPSFGPPSSASRSEFDRAVAPVNVPSEVQQKELEQIKADALWLSQDVGLEEVESLRVVLLEWQNRPELRLHAGFADAELASLRDALGVEHAHTLDLVPGGSFTRADDDFDSADARKCRILQTFYRSQTSMMALAREALQATDTATADKDDALSQWQSLLASSADCTLKDAIFTSTSHITTLLEELPKPRSWDSFAPDRVHQLDADFITCKLQCVAIQLQILLLRVHDPKETVTAEILQEWLSFLAGHDHFIRLPASVSVQLAAVELTRSAASYISLALIRPWRSLVLLDDPSIDEGLGNQSGTHFFLDYDKIRPMFDPVMYAAMSADPYASPAVLAWGMIFSKMRVLASYAKQEREARQVQKAIDRPQLADGQNRRLSGSSIGSTGESLFEQIVNEIPLSSGGQDGPGFLLNMAVKGSNVFEVVSSLAAAAHDSSTLLGSFQLEILQDLLAAARSGLGYEPDLFKAQLALLSPAGEPTIERWPFKPVVNFVGNSFLCEQFLDVAASRFPYEALPFLRITKLLATARNQSLFLDDVHYITGRLQSMHTFTQAAVGGFDAYHTTHEDENANLVALHRSVGILDYRPSRLLTTGGRGAEAQVIPGGAVGEVISESMPPVICWTHSYSALALLGKWLELHVKSELSNILSPFDSANDVAAAAIGLLSVLLNTTYSHEVACRSQEDARQLCQSLLEEMSLLLDTERDVVDCVFDLIEQQLVSTRRFSPASGCDLLTACVDFITVLCKIKPLQLWPILVKSSALAAHGAKRSVFAVIASVEVPMQTFALLESCSKLLQATIDLVVTVSTKSDVTRGLKARSAPAQRPLATAVLGLTETMYAAFEALPSWIFLGTKQKEAVLGNLCDAFSNLLYRSFGTGPAYDSDSNITVCYRPAADFLLNALSGTGVQSLGSGPVALNLVSSMLTNVSDVLVPNGSSHLRSLLLLARTHLGCSRLSGHVLREVNTTLVDLFPVFVRLPLIHASLLRPCLTLECDIFDAFKPGSTPHLLGHLGSLSCLSFLDSLRYLNARAYEEVHISWRLISRLITLDQQWTAVVLITGSPPGREQKDAELPKLRTRGKPLLQQALDKLVSINAIDSTVAVALLKLLTEAQQSWPSVTDAITARRDLFPALINYVSAKTSYDRSDLRQALHNQVAAGVTDLSIISLHAMTMFRDETKFAVFMPLLQWLTVNAVQVAGYNASMHANLKKNFAKKYDGLDVSIIQRTGVLRIPYGVNYFYDLDFADKMLEDDPHWNNGPQSFHVEFQRANVNLSVVDSELILLRSFKHVCSEHGMFFAKHKVAQPAMALIAKICLHSNNSPTPSEALFDTLALSRVEIAAMVLGPLVTVGATGPPFTDLLKPAYDTARQRNGSYELALTNDDLTYWRSMLNVVRLCMQFHVTKSKPTIKLGETQVEAIDQSNPLFCEIAAHVVGEGLRSVVTALQDQKERSKGMDAQSETADAKDVLLLLNTFQTMLRLPSLPQIATQLASALVSTGAPQSLLLLFSWSHLLDATPVYGVLAARFLASISKLAPIAEELAVDGVFNSLLLAKMTQKLQKMPYGVGHLERRPNAAMLYTIWSDGFLRICLNLLDAIGGGVAAEAAGFLNQFPEQLARSSLAFSTNPSRAEGSEGFTIGAACELTNLSLLSFILERLRMAGASSAVDPTQIMPLAGFDEHKAAIAADIKDVVNQELQFRLKREVPTNDIEAAWAKKKLRPIEEGKQSETLLDQKMMKQLTDARRCLLPEGED